MADIEAFLADVRDTPEYAAAWDLEVWKQAEQAKHQRALAALKRKVQAELRAEHDQLMAEKLQQQRRLEEKAKAELLSLQRQKEHLQQSARVLAKTLREREEEYQRLSQDCTARVLRAQEAELLAKEAAKRMEGVNRTLMEKMADLQQQCLDLRQRVAELKGADQRYEEGRAQAARDAERREREAARLEADAEGLRTRLAAAMKETQRLADQLADRDREVQALHRKLQKSRRTAPPSVGNVSTPEPATAETSPLPPPPNVSLHLQGFARETWQSAPMVAAAPMPPSPPYWCQPMSPLVVVQTGVAPSAPARESPA
eukprot:EG_transcript_20061